MGHVVDVVEVRTRVGAIGQLEVGFVERPRGTLEVVQLHQRDADGLPDLGFGRGCVDVIGRDEVLGREQLL